MRLVRVARSLRVVLVPAIVAALVAFPLGVLASHSFSDVPDSNPFHADIAALKDSGVSTTGCGGGKFCPDDFVTRGQMAAFLNRLGALSPSKTPVTNADRLDGLDSTAFLPFDGTATDSDRLDGLDSTSFMGSTVTKRESAAPSIGTLLNGTRYREQACNAGEKLLSGGPANIDAGTILLESFPIASTFWRVRIENDGTDDAFSVVVLCASR